jgi:hypothetical protein
MNERWLAIFTAVVGVFLFIVGGVGVLGIDASRTVTLDPLSPFGTVEYVEWVRGTLPFFYLVAAEGIGLGAVAFISAVGLLSGRKWAPRMLVWGSVVLAIMSVTIIIIAPGSWDIQAAFLAFSGVLWWQLWLWRRRNASAP